MPVAAGVAAISMLLTPLAIRVAPRIASAVDAGLPRRLQTFVALYGSWIERMAARRTEGLPRTRRLIRQIVIDALLLVLIAASAALLGDDAKRWLRLSTELSVLSVRWLVYSGFALLALPVAIGLWRSIAALGRELAWRALPRAASADDVDFAQAPRRVFVLSLQLGLLLVVSLPLLAITQPLLPELPGLFLLLGILLGSCIAFWRSTGELIAHTRAGATAMLEALGQLSGRSSDTVEDAADNEQMDALEALLPGLGDFAGLQLVADSPAVGKSLASLNLRGLTGATVLAIRRGEDSVITPTGEAVLAAADVLILAGSNDALRGARELLLRG
jgi:CPA2 family monovalent cation:H+ antiporter-2